VKQIIFLSANFLSGYFYQIKNFEAMWKYLLICLSLFPFFISAQTPALQKSVWEGVASYYHAKFNGRRTASGEKFSNEALTAANNFLKLGTRVRVTNLKNGKMVEVVINDRMNARNKRLIDLSAAAAKALGFFGNGLCRVKIEII
jgi:rare lipoprotein A